MKTAKYLIPALMMCAMLTGCEKEDIDRFSPEYSALNIWLGSSNIPLDEQIYNYSYSIGEKAVPFYVRVSGLAADVDRTFTLEAVSGSLAEANGSYRTETYTIPAGATEAEFELYFDSSKLAPGAFADKDGEIVFRMADNDSFRTGAKELSALKFVLRNYLSRPDDWDSATFPYRAYSLYFGAYSEVKYKFMIEVTGLVDFRIHYNQSQPYDEAANTISTAYATYLQQLLRIELNKYNSTHDTPLCDDLGEPITF